MAKDSLVKGTAILAAAAFIARILGVVQRIPLVYLIHKSGMATFGIAFNIYTLLLTIATAGIPSALSKLVAERMETGRVHEANRIYRAAVQFALAAGVVMTLFLLWYAPYYANSSQDPDATLAIRALAPALLLFPLIAIMRGYFQGRQMMMPNGLSQIIEQILRIVFAVGLAWLLLAAGKGHVWAVAGASFGGVTGSIGAVAVLIWYYVKLKRSDARQGLAGKAIQEAPSEQPLRYGKIFSMIFKVSIPIVLFSMAVPFIYFIDSSTTIPLLSGSIGAARAKDLLGILTGQAQSLAGIPIILAIALSQSVVPIIASAYARRDMQQVSRQSSKALQLSVLTGLPVVLVIAIAARPINGFLFPDTEGSGIIAFLTVTALFQIIMQTSGSILMGLGEMRPLVVHVIIGMIVKLAGSFALAPLFGMYGIVGATALCFIVMMGLNLRVLQQKVPFEILSRKRWRGLFAGTAFICLAGVPLEWLTNRYITMFPAKVNYFLNCAIVGSAVMLLYPLLLVALKVVTKEHAADLPGPVRKLLSRFTGRLSGKAEASGK